MIHNSSLYRKANKSADFLRSEKFKCCVARHKARFTFNLLCFGCFTLPLALAPNRCQIKHTTKAFSDLILPWRASTFNLQRNFQASRRQASKQKTQHRAFLLIIIFYLLLSSSRGPFRVHGMMMAMDEEDRLMWMNSSEKNSCSYYIPILNVEIKGRKKKRLEFSGRATKRAKIIKS